MATTADTGDVLRPVLLGTQEGKPLRAPAMKIRRDRRIAWLTGVIVCLLALANLLRFRGHLVEEWWYSMLWSGPETVRLRAIYNLSQKPSDRILTVLYVLRNDEHESPPIRDAAAKALAGVVARIKGPWAPGGPWSEFQRARLQQPDT